MSVNSLKHLSKHSISGLTLVEVMVTVTVLSMMLVGLAGLDRTCRGLVRAQRETAQASQLLEETVERLRAGNWSQLTDPTAMSQTLGGLQSASLDNLEKPRLRLTVSTYPPVSPQPTPLVVERASDGTVQIVSAPPVGFSLRSLLSVRVDARVTWQSGARKADRMREVSSVVSLSGLLR
jgi:hypothetical protein